MKSVQLKQYGKAEEALAFNNETPTPELKPGQVLVENHAASVNPFDVKIAKGVHKDSIPLVLPVIPGGDFSGIITEVGEGVTEYQKGDEVYGSANILSGNSGAFAEVVAANTKNIAKKPANVSFEEAASLVLAGVSAVQALTEHIDLQPGQKILIHGGAGGIGSLAIQIAKSIGAYVATTVSDNDVEFVKSLGADKIINYRTEKFEEVVKDFDAVYDTVGGDTTDRSFQVLKEKGVLVSMLGEPKAELGIEKNIIRIGQSTSVRTDRLQKLAELVESGKVKPQIEEVLPFESLAEGYEIVEHVHPKGKIVIKIK